MNIYGKSLFVENQSTYKYGKSLFANNVQMIPNNLYITASSSSGYSSGYCEEEYLIRKLMMSTPVTTIVNYYSQYKSGNFTAVTTVLDASAFSALSLELSKLQLNQKYTVYEMVRQSLLRSFESLMQSVYQYAAMKTAQGELISAKEKASILDDLDKLNAYIEELNLRTDLFIIPNVEVTAPLISIKREYARYIELHGFPEGGIFDSDILGDIIAAMNAGQ